MKLLIFLASFLFLVPFSTFSNTYHEAYNDGLTTVYHGSDGSTMNKTSIGSHDTYRKSNGATGSDFNNNMPRSVNMSDGSRLNIKRW